MKKLLLGIASLAVSFPLLAGDGPNPCEFQHSPKTMNCAIDELRSPSHFKYGKNKIENNIEPPKKWPLHPEDARP
ncbi:hypothetical protein [Endozoicomonas lisbonensis]|uniref:Uncharacterized protein n=1 Tax=Endozoicomonas lisbonensis TaxID=3120522 RepID=A0ABV2SBE6_9GAMM